MLRPEPVLVATGAVPVLLALTLFVGVAAGDCGMTGDGVEVTGTLVVDAGADEPPPMHID